MPTPIYHNNICYLLQKAAASFLQGTAQDGTSNLSFVDQAHIFQGLSAVEVENPRVVLQAIKATSDTQFEGNWLVNLRILLYENADDTMAGAEDTFHQHAGELFAQFMTATIAVDLTGALDNFTAQFVFPVEQGWGVKDRQWFAYLDVTVNCCGSDIDIT